MTDVCQNWREIEVNKKNRAEIRRIDDSHSHIHTITEEGQEEEYTCHPDSPNYYHLRCLLTADIYILSDIICGNKDHII